MNFDTNFIILNAKQAKADKTERARSVSPSHSITSGSADSDGNSTEDEVSKNDEFCIQNEELCTKNEKTCNKTEEFCITK